MRKISEIYEEYNIMRNLREHQMRVAAVALQIADNFSEDLDKKIIIVACLLHDMGNILKSDLNVFPEFVLPEGVDYWEKVKSEFMERYGTDDHEAHLKIATELGVSDGVLECIDAVGFENWSKTYKEGDWHEKISAYADSRVAPYGVVPLEDRLEEARVRYPVLGSEAEQGRKIVYDFMREIEKDIFLNSSIKQSDITDESIKSYLEKLKDFEI